ncbi:heat-inducible transcription repressor HrcA [Terasakiella brassicae]|uniref:Heat-inducible transcription repressor HrcA n=1 Tax=Terasakiella brassicae TaxID=1634917 RepID=A0A917FDH0_9PROT|nr:heat-inducible transcriptional repressor HrcA [Terasakiella brassicae]GGF73051.1 heat-inducible transcription repressor HrcA [Terasakiella brassicae]
MLSNLNDRSRDIFRRIVDAYMETGEPVGSRTVSKLLENSLSPASIRNVMADLEDLGLLHSPHTSAGRMPTEQGLRLFIDGVMEIGDLPANERKVIDKECSAKGRKFEDVMSEASGMISGLSGCASLVFAPKTDSPLKHIEFVNLSPGRTLVIMVMENGVVENRVIDTPHDIPPSALVQASNYLGAKLVGRTVAEGLGEIHKELKNQQAQLDELTSRVVKTGLAQWAGGTSDSGSLIVRGQAHLLDDIAAIGDLERIRSLFEALETKETLLKLLHLADGADGVQIFIGSDNPLFNVSGCSMVVAPFRDGHQKIVGAIGVIGPTRINYARIIPMVDYTSKVIGRLIG